MKFDKYLTRIPDLHRWEGQENWCSGGFGPFHLRAIYDLALACGEHAVILETGAGNSTLTFLFASPAKLISIAPDAPLFERIGAFCEREGIDAAPLEAHVDISELVLPELARGETNVDLALIDGGHGWPTVFVDFCYINAMLRRDGVMILDDLHLHSVKELARLLMRDRKRFTLERDMGKSLAVRKLTDERFLPDWMHEPYIVSRSARNSAFPNDLFPGFARYVLGRALRPAQLVYWSLSQRGPIGTARWLRGLTGDAGGKASAKDSG
jgi:hypothetical protein